MPRPRPPLAPFERNVHSQFGEDGVIARALEIIGERDHWCVEFGAWDGQHLSNTCALIDDANYHGVLIEADPVKFRDLQKRQAKQPRIHAVQRFVEFEGRNTLDAILAETPIPKAFDVLSIDIDGNDYHIWDSLRVYRPKLVVIEHNPTIPNEVDFVQTRDMSVQQGSSLTAMARLANSKGYRLVHATTCNGIFVDEKYFEAFGITDDSPEALRADLSKITYFFQTHDGRIHLAGHDMFLFHGLPLDAQQLQPLPRVLQTYPPNFSRFQNFCWRRFRRLQKWMRRLRPVA